MFKIIRHAIISFNRFGLLVRHWTMRFEAKHSYFKQLAQSMGNFVNILAMRHQLYQSYLNIDRQHLPGWEHNLESGPGKNVFTLAIITSMLFYPGSVANSDVISDQLEFPVSNVFRYINFCTSIYYYTSFTAVNG